MKISLNWLQDFITLKTKDIALIQETITNRSAEIEEVILEGESLQQVKVGEILKIEKHPDADKLNVTQTTIGSETFQIVCGANNIREGQKVPVALVGAVLPNGMQIQKAKIRGVASFGMICSESELGVAEDSEGIWELPTDTPLGMTLSEFLGMNDVVLEIDNTAITNRPDLFSHVGFANEFVANALAEPKKHQEKRINTVTNKFPLEIKLMEEILCPHYTAVILKNIKIKPSPAWMQKRLRAVGIRPINNVVDVTNYVMMELGMPLHAFDLQTIQGKKITMRRSQKGEKVTTLDAVARTLPADVILLEDEKKIFDLCGIMGGANSEISLETTDIWLHAPIYNATLIRKAMLALAHRTEAATMYEKGVPAIRSREGIERALELLLEMLPEAQIESEILEITANQAEERIIDLPKKELRRVMNLEIEDTQVQSILTQLGFKVQITPAEYQITVPPYRYGDIQAKHDLVEEVVRIYDINNLPEVAPVAPLKIVNTQRGRQIERKIKNLFAEIGFHEILTYSFLGKELLQKTGLDSNEQTLEILNPLSQENALMRTQLLPSLLENAQKNLRFQTKFNLFEVAKVYYKENNLNSIEEKHCAGLMLNNDFFTLKGKLQFVFAKLGLSPRFVKPQNLEKYMHPGRSADILLGKEIIGFVTEIHPLVKQNFDLEEQIVAFEINLEKITVAKSRAKKYVPVSKFPGIKMDVSLIFDEKKAIEQITKKIQKTDSLIVTIKLSDIYTGAQIPAGKKSLTYAIEYQAFDRTLTDQEVNALHQKVILNLEKLGGELRR